MILKEKQLTNSQDPRLREGEDAEKQMAFYLHRAFAKKNDCFVLNDLRVTHSDDTAQIDHLIVTQFGLFIIESKSVHGKIVINEFDEWSRTYNKISEGMPSPVLQAEAQGAVLKELLKAHKEQLLGKVIFGKVQKGFLHCPIFVYVAISDSGIIDRKKEVTELFKADQISNKILTELESLKKKNNPLSLSLSLPWEMELSEVKTVAEFLLSQHQPKQANKSLPVKQEMAEYKTTPKNETAKGFVPKTGAICPVCGTHKLIRKSVTRSDNTETDFLACAAYPKECKAIFALVAVAKSPNKPEKLASDKQEYKENDTCPRCKNGTLVGRKAKTEFLGCSQYPKCKFTSYRD